MRQSPTINRRIVLHRHPHGAPTADNFRLESGPIPSPSEGQVLLRTRYLSLDPYMRGRMSDGPSYAVGVPIGQVMVGATVSVVEASRSADFNVGDLVLAQSGWQDYALANPSDITGLVYRDMHPSLALGVMGMPGFTAYMGLLDIGRPLVGETVVVGAASGAVGAVVGQIAKLKGCRVVGVAGGEDKCSYVLDELGFDACLDHRTDELPGRLASACPKGIDVYFENVGGAVFDAALPLLNTRARIPLCGLIAHYNDTSLPPGPDRLGLLMGTLLRKRIRLQGFITSQDYGERYSEFRNDMAGWLADGLIKSKEHIVQDLESAPEAFIGMLHGKNFGKLMVCLADE